MTHLVAKLDWVGLDLGSSPGWWPLLYLLPKQDGGTSQIKVIPNQSQPNPGSPPDVSPCTLTVFWRVPLIAFLPSLPCSFSRPLLKWIFSVYGIWLKSVCMEISTAMVSRHNAAEVEQSVHFHIQMPLKSHCSRPWKTVSKIK